MIGRFQCRMLCSILCTDLLVSIALFVLFVYFVLDSLGPCGNADGEHAAQQTQTVTRASLAPTTSTKYVVYKNQYTIWFQSFAFVSGACCRPLGFGRISIYSASVLHSEFKFKKYY